jgi:hypothetical protein
MVCRSQGGESMVKLGFGRWMAPLAFVAALLAGSDAANAYVIGFGEGISFYEGPPRVKPPVAVLQLRWAGHLLSCKRFLRWLARFDCECERDALVTTFYPCRRGWPSTRCCIRPKRARRTGFGRSAPSIRTAAHIARPRKITGASSHLQRCRLLCLSALRGQISEAMSRASSGITPSSR